MAVVLVILLLWWLLAAVKVIPSSILASPAAVLKEARSSGGAVSKQLGATVRETAMALGIAWIGGLLLGLVLGAFRAVRPLLGLARSAYAVPVVIVYPIFTVWFGYGSLSKVLFGAFAGIVPMMLMTASAVSTVDFKIIRVFESMGCSRWALVRKAILPASLPGVVSALRLSGSLAFVSVIVGEMLVSTHGLGYWIANSASTYNTPAVYLGICFVVALAIVLHALIGLLQKGLSSYKVRNML